jgi:hypothetical protein
MKEDASMRSPRSRHLCIFLVLFWLIGCGAATVELAFETVANEGSGSNVYNDHEPDLFVVTALEELEPLSHFVSHDARERLQLVDYDTYMVVAAFQGWRPDTGYGIEIEKVVRQGDTVSVIMELDEDSRGLQ